MNGGRTAAVPWLFSLPALAFLGFFLLVPVASLVALSFFKAGPDGGYEFSLALYRDFISDPYSRGMFWTTFKLSLITTVISLVIAFPVALYMRQIAPRWRSLLAFILLSPLLTSVVVRTLAWVILLGPKGVVNAMLTSIGLSPVVLIYNEIGVVIGLVHVFFGYMALTLMSSVLRIDENLLMAASNLGASRWQILWKIIVPLSLPGVLSGSILVFTLSASTYATPTMLGGSSTKLLATEVYDLAINYIEWPEASTVSIFLFGLVAVVVMVGWWIAESGKRKAVFQ